jgi:hypothetical protein
LNVTTGTVIQVSGETITMDKEIIIHRAAGTGLKEEMIT